MKIKAFYTCINMLFFQPFYFPKPTGVFVVGRQTFVLPATKTTKPDRPVKINVWYPAIGELKTTPYAPDIMKYYKKTDPINSFFYGYYRPIYAYFKNDAPIHKPKTNLYPIIFFLHGYNSNDEHYVTFYSEFASHGYMVISLNHTFDANFIAFPDGKIIMHDTKASAHNDYFAEENFLDSRIEKWIEDVSHSWKFLCKKHLEKNNVFSHANLKKTAIIGHSFGGATAIQCCRRMPQFKFGINLDGTLYGKNFETAFKKPLLFMCTTDDLDTLSPEELKAYEKRNNAGIISLAKKMEPISSVINVQTAGHSAFSDFLILKHASIDHKHFHQNTGINNGFILLQKILKILLKTFALNQF